MKQSVATKRFFSVSDICKIAIFAMIFIAQSLIAQSVESSDFDERYASFTTLDSASLKKPTNSTNLKNRTLDLANPKNPAPNSTNLKSQDSRLKNQPKSAQDSPPKTLPILTAPLNFDFDLERWLPRLVQIVNSTDGTPFSIGVCGTCLLQVYEMVAEILLYGNNPPTQDGYFFNPAPRTNPFVNFRQRHSMLYTTLNDIVEYYVIPARNPQERFANSARVIYASAISMLPQYRWQHLGNATTQSEITRLLEQVLQGSVGTLYVTSMTHRNSAGVNSHHSVLLVRTSAGVRVLQTNVTGAPDYYLRQIARANTTAQSLQDSLNQVGTQGSTLIMLGIAQVSGQYDIPFASALSFSDCTGDGNGRRGNAQIPSAGALNQCASGRCNQ